MISVLKSKQIQHVYFFYRSVLGRIPGLCKQVFITKINRYLSKIKYWSKEQKQKVIIKPEKCKKVENTTYKN